MLGSSDARSLACVFMDTRVLPPRAIWKVTGISSRSRVALTTVPHADCSCVVTELDLVCAEQRLHSKLQSFQGSTEPLFDPACSCCSNPHTNPGFMEDLKHLGQPFVPLVSRHLRWKMWEQGRACSFWSLSPMLSPHMPQYSSSSSTHWRNFTTCSRSSSCCPLLR